MKYQRPIELYKVFENVVDSIRQTGVITSSIEDSGIYTIVSENTLIDYEYITINSVDYKVRNTSELGFIIEAATGIDFTGETWKAKAPYYMHEKEKKAAEVLAEKTTKDNLRLQKYPLVLLTHPYTTEHGQLSYSVDAKVFIITLTEQSYWSDDRYKKIIEPVIFPIYENLISAMAGNSDIKASFPQYIKHRKMDLLLIDKNPFPDKMDGVTLLFKDLQILNKIQC